MKKIFISILIISCFLISLIFLLKKDNKMKINGNNKSIKEIEEYFVNINYYKANIDVTIKSNKNENKYNMNQVVTKDYSLLKIIEPSSITDMEILYKENTLHIKNTKLNLSKIYTDYPYISNNVLFLTNFLNKYKEKNKSNIEEKDGKIYMKLTDLETKNYSEQILTINKEKMKPEHLEVKDTNKQCKVYILYNEIELNI